MVCNFNELLAKCVCVEVQDVAVQWKLHWFCKEISSASGSAASVATGAKGTQWNR